MNNQQSDNQQMTVESCVQTCSGLGYSVAGMEYSVQWYVLPTNAFGAQLIES